MTETLPGISRLVIVLISSVSLWDAITFATLPRPFTIPLWVFLEIGSLAAMIFALAGLAIAWVWPRTRPGQLLGWAMALAAFTWVDFTLAPLLSEPLPYEGFLLALGPVGRALSFADRASLWFLSAALARFAVLFPKALEVAKLPTDWKNLPAPGARLTGRLQRFFEYPIDERLPSWLTRKRGRKAQAVFGMTVWRWAIENPGRIWAIAALTPFVALPALLMGSEILEKLAWGAEYAVLFTAAAIFGWALRLQYAIGGAEDRQRLLWIVEGGTIALLLYFVWAPVYLVTDLGPEVFSEALRYAWSANGLPFMAVTYIAICFSLGPVFFMVLASLLATTFYRGAIDPGLAVRKTTVYGVLGVLFLFLFAGLGNAAEGLLQSSLGLPSFAGAVFTGGTIAVVLIPVKRRMDRLVNRILPATALAETPTQTVAILFSDLVGFIALSGTDQKAGLTVMSVFHKAADRVARENRGRFVKAVADEVMLEFNDPAKAVRAASQLRDEFHEAARRVGLPTPEIRTGIHYGEVTRSGEGGLFGDAVNIASRVQGAAEPGQIALSVAVKDRLGEGEFDLESLGARQMKNVAGSVECYRLKADLT